MTENIIPFLQSQTELLVYYKQEMRDDQAARWTAKEYYNAINRALQAQASRGAWVPYIYSLTDGFATGTYEYTLPWYVRAPLDVQQQVTILLDDFGFPVYLGNDLGATWVDVPAWELVTDGAGGQKLLLGVNPWPVAARVIWWGENSRLPQSVPTLSSTITDTATSLTIASKPTIGPAGFVKVEDEWISYNGYTVDSSTTTLTNLVRGWNGTTEAAHTSGVSVAWGVAEMREDLFFQLSSQVYANLHNLFLTNASPQETQNHIFQVRFYQQMADEYWQRFTPVRHPKMRLSRRGIGLMTR